MQIAIGIVLIIAAVFLIVAVLMQQGKSHNLSGVISGGADTFFGKEKGSTLNNKLSRLTTIVAIVFALLVLVSYFMQDTVDLSSYTTDLDTSGIIGAPDDDTTVDGGETEPEAEGESEDGNTDADADTDADTDAVDAEGEADVDGDADEGTEP